MAGSSLLALIDDIATTLDDVAILTKIAAKKTSGVLGDDLALNAEQVAGVAAHRELPVVFAVGKGSLINKLILVPAALIVSRFLPAAIIPSLMLGGAYLCFEGFEKVFEKIFHKNKNKIQEHHPEDILRESNLDVIQLEKEKIKGAIRTDFILSAEIVVITLGTVANFPLLKQALVLSGIAMLMTFGVYGLVAAIVKLDDLGLYLCERDQPAYKKNIGKLILKGAPHLMKLLGVVGTVAMFLVGGGIISHNLAAVHHLATGLNMVFSAGFDLLVGLMIGFLCFLIVKFVNILKSSCRLGC